VLEQACSQVRAWQGRHSGRAPLMLSVNLSAKQFQQPKLVENIAAILRRIGFDPRNLELEITESIALEDVKAAAATLHELKKLGLHLGIDDFGTGYSALSYLKQY